jgi:ubiquinone/menaquinone biosynthesis C-methylase UbiE
LTDAAFWNGLADKYARQPVANPEAFERKIEITKSRMKSSDIVLDIGCGTGSLALRLAPAAAHVHALDLSSEMIRIANEKARAQRVDNVTFHVGALDDSFATLKDGELDGICAYSILHLLEQRAPALERMFRLLKPGGFFVSSTVCLAESRMPLGLPLAVMRWFGKAPLVRIFSRRTLEQELRRAGFVELAQPDVGAKSTVAFIVASKPR